MIWFLVSYKNKKALEDFKLENADMMSLSKVIFTFDPHQEQPIIVKPLSSIQP